MEARVREKKEHTIAIREKRETILKAKERIGKDSKEIVTTNLLGRRIEGEKQSNIIKNHEIRNPLSRQVVYYKDYKVIIPMCMVF